MNKSILIMNTPENCYKCLLNNNFFCNATNICVVKFIDSRPDWCPLKQLPERYDKVSCDGSPFYHMSVGWNNCIDEILGDNDDGI